LLPALLVALPASLLVLLATSELSSWWGRVGVVVLASGVPVLITQVVRDLGRRLEPGLFAAWGGLSTTAFLRWSGPEPRPVVQRRHELLSRVLGVELPFADQEEADREAADHLYAVAVMALRERTRDEARFPLVTKELATYGFRRNMLGCRAFGMLVALLSAVAVVVLAALGILSLHIAVVVSLLVFDTLCVLVWWLLVTPAWVRNAAEHYAQRLLGSVEVLTAENGAVK
jgi:hypothetical protein